MPSMAMQMIVSKPIEMAQEELIEKLGKAEYQSEEFEELAGELTHRVREELKRQMRNPAAQCEADEEAAILRGFDEAATWHLDAARNGDFAKSIADAVREYLSLEREVYAEQHAERS